MIWAFVLPDLFLPACPLVHMLMHSRKHCSRNGERHHAWDARVSPLVPSRHQLGGLYRFRTDGSSSHQASAILSREVVLMALQARTQVPEHQTDGRLSAGAVWPYWGTSLWTYVQSPWGWAAGAGSWNPPRRLGAWRKRGTSHYCM